MTKIKNRIMTKEFVRKINEDADKNMANIEKNCSELHDKYKTTAELFEDVANSLKNL